jgi:hypothetical protein
MIPVLAEGLITKVWHVDLSNYLQLLHGLAALLDCVLKLYDSSGTVQSLWLDALG